MVSKGLVVFLLVQVNLQSILAFSSGPPLSESLCTSMVPGHGGNSQPLGRVVVKLANPALCYRPGQALKVDVARIVNNNKEVEIEGLMLIMKKLAVMSDSYGSIQYTGSQALKTDTCFGKPNSVLHHTQERKRFSFSFNWTPPTTLTGDIAMMMTVVESYSVYFVNIQKMIPECGAVVAGTTTTKRTNDRSIVSRIFSSTTKKINGDDNLNANVTSVSNDNSADSSDDGDSSDSLDK